jgi:poly(hydroxyalkanoate) depolymerase family esterase
MKLARIVIVLLLGTASSLSAAQTKTTTTLSSSLNPSTYGQAVTFTAVVTSALGAPPDGETVAFMHGGNVLGTGALSGGSATFATSMLTRGTDTVKAVYVGDGNFAGSTSNVVSQVVDPAATTTTLASSQNPSVFGQPVTFTASVTPEFGGTVTGKVAFYNGSTKLRTVSLSSGVASYTTTKLPSGTDPITAVYNGSSSFTTSTSGALSQVVEIATTIDSTMTWDNVTRYYEVYLPANLPANPPLLLMLHGTQTSATFDPETVISLNWGWQPVADEYGFILVQPASTYDPGSGQWNWNAYFMDGAFPPAESGTCAEPPATGCPDDAGFLRQLILNLTAQYNVNPSQIYVTGMSSGAQMTERVGVEISDLVAAIAPVSGQLVGQQDPPPGLPSPPLAPISVQEWHGTLDKVLPPCNYGTTKYSGVTFTLDTVDDTFNYWAAQNSCTTLESTQPLCVNDEPDPNVTGNEATGCTNNVEVQFIWEEDVGHVWNPKNETAIWLFLAANPMQSTRSR